MKLLNYYGDVIGDYICICAYMLLVNFHTCSGVELLVNACTFIAVEIAVDYSR